jgi:hypothetical protein
VNQTYVYCYIIMIEFYCHQNSYGKTMEHRCPIYIMTMMHLLGFKGASGSKVGRVSIFFFPLFTFFANELCYNFFYFEIWLKYLVCKLNVFFCDVCCMLCWVCVSIISYMLES